MTHPDPSVVTPQGQGPGPGRDAGSGPSSGQALRTRISERSVLAAALLPLRLFLGVTYLYAGIDKILDPHFFVAGDPFSVAAQMEGYMRSSPLAPLIEAALPVAIPIGVLIALAELAIGIGLLTGLAYRVSAWAGFGLSMLFWLTASWSIAPYFFSPDLPYAFGFLTLALAGHGHLLVVEPWPSRDGRRSSPGAEDAGADVAAAGVAMAPPAADPSRVDAAPGASRDAASPGRRALLQVGILAALTLLTAGALSRIRALGAEEAAAGGASPTPAPTPGPTVPATTAPTVAPTAPPATAGPAATAAPTAPPTAAPTAVAGASGPVIASVTDLQPNAGLPFLVPNEAPFALGPGGPGVLVELSDGRFVAYSAVCSHGRCTVAYDPTVRELVCPCHAGRFDPANAAAVLGGPPPSPLAEIPIAVDGAGQIHVVLEA